MTLNTFFFLSFFFSAFLSSLSFCFSLSLWPTLSLIKALCLSLSLWPSLSVSLKNQKMAMQLQWATSILDCHRGQINYTKKGTTTKNQRWTKTSNKYNSEKIFSNHLQSVPSNNKIHILLGSTCDLLQNKPHTSPQNALLSTCRSTERIPCTFSAHSARKLEINHKRNHRNYANTWESIILTWIINDSSWNQGKN